MPAAEIARIARGVAAEVAQTAGIKPRVLDSLDFHAVAFPSGVAKTNTIVASFIDPSAEKSRYVAERDARRTCSSWPTGTTPGSGTRRSSTRWTAR